MKIYIVYGRTGEYEDRTEWAVKAFRTELSAKNFCDLCNSYVQNSDKWSNRACCEFVHPIDSECVMDSGGTEYIIGWVDYEDK